MDKRLTDKHAPDAPPEGGIESLAPRKRPSETPAKATPPVNPGAAAAQRVDLSTPPIERVSMKMTYFCITFSVLLMFLVGSLSLVYTRGVVLVSEIDLLGASQPDRRFGQLERQMLVAQEQIFPVAPGEPPPQPLPQSPGERVARGTFVKAGSLDDLAQESSYVILHELLDLNKALLSLQRRVAAYDEELSYPLPGMKSAAQGLGIVGAPATNGDPMINFYCTQRYNAADKPATPEQSNIYMLGMNMAQVLDQACKYNLGYVSTSVPSVREWSYRIKEGIEPYGIWVLPCLYAALGSMIFYMRLILDPQQQNPPFFRVAHRMSLAALAGMIITWFWEPAFGSDGAFNTVGFGLFTFAFIVGFSIDVFFSLLDRLVSISLGAVNRLGTASG
ncbi:MAG TPA: hypothetical protein VIU14_06525 [Mesorhizobium sp.]